MAEKWVAVPNTDGAIEVSSLGRVRSSLRERGTILKTQNAGGDACAAVDNIATKPKARAVFRVA